MKKIFFIALFLIISFFHTEISSYANDDLLSQSKENFNAQRDFSDKKIFFQEPASTSMVEIIKLHHIMFFTVFTIFIFVCVFLLIITIKFKESNGHKPKNFTHNIKLEIFWTSVPFAIVIFLAVFSLRSLNKLEKLEYSQESDVTLKIVGHQWYWTYEYPKYGIKFDSYMKQEKDLLKGDKRLLSTDNVIYLPENKNIKLVVTADDVIHSWTIPAFGVKKDCVPGRLNETWFKPTKQGVFYGQCSELCGARHGFMPIEVKIVDEKEFEKWALEAKKTFPL